MLKSLRTVFICLSLACEVFVSAALAQPNVQAVSPAPHHGSFKVDVHGVLSRSDIVLERPNLEAAEAMPLGNGRLGVAVWSAEGFTAQLNRNDTLPDRLSSGQVVIPGLSALTAAKDYSGHLDLYRGEFQEKGGGMTATAFVESNTDGLIVDVTGANPGHVQTAELRLWSPRTPHATAAGSSGSFAEHWLDDQNPGFSGRAFGSLCGITAVGRDVSAVVTGPLTITVSFKPFADGHFRIIVASPHYDGSGDPKAIVDRALAPEPDAAHLSSWRDFWARAAIIRIASKDGAGEYMENLRNIYLFVAAIEKGVEYPGSQAGIADMISSARDEHRWDPAAFWHWNLRMQVAANIGAGLTELNEPYFNLYRENLAHIETWTRLHMNGIAGSCVPETMRFNGQGIEYEHTWKPVSIGRDCDAEFKPYYNARTISTGAEISLWVWKQYLATGDRNFLAENYPLMASSARFLLSYQEIGPDGFLHTHPSNAHETQWDVTDPTTDIAAITALYPATIQAAHLLGRDADLARQLQAALARIPAFPRTPMTGPRTLLSPSKDDGSTVIAESYEPAAQDHNIENIGLEPVWPYDLIGDKSALLPLAKRTYEHRPNSSAVDWSFDPIQAARLGLGSEVEKTLIETTEKFQGFVNGMAKWEPEAKEFYIEQTAVLADALQEALIQDYDGVIRIAPAIPPGWDFDGSVYVYGNTKVDVQTRNGAVVTVVIEAGSSQPVKIRNPWPSKTVDVISAQTGKTVVTSSDGDVIEFTASKAASYLIERQGSDLEKITSAPLSGTKPTSARKLGRVQIGLLPDSQ